MKWGFPHFEHKGIVGSMAAFKQHCSLGFWKGKLLKDPHKLFNTRLESNTVRAIDFHEGDTVDEAALKALILDAVRLNTPKERER